MLLPISIFFSFLSITSAGVKPGFVIGQKVNTSSGIVQGHPESNFTEVSEYLGIPYAQAATGALRLAAPVAFTGTDLLPGDNYSDDCPGATLSLGTLGSVPDSLTKNVQILVALASAQGTPGSNVSEDCLSINVWTKPQIGEKRKAVMVWFLPGAFQQGTSHAPAWNPAEIVDQEDVVAVTFNYRIFFLGFAAPPNSPDYNFGLLDQRMAVKWVETNIAGFGGDPTRITLWGQSSGGASVAAYSYAWTENPIANAFISESAPGAVVRGDPLANEKWLNVSTALQCDGPNSLACVRSKSLDAVMNATASTGRFQPIVDNVTVFSDYNARGKAGNFIKRPMLVGNNNNEERLFSAPDGHLPPEVEAMQNADYTCGTSNLARYRAVNGVPAFRYLYMGDFPNMNISVETGAFHSAEFMMIIGNVAELTGIPDTDAEKALGSYMRGMWTTFAKNPDRGLQDVLKLPVYVPEEDTVIQLGFENMVLPVLASSSNFDGVCNGTYTL